MNKKMILRIGIIIAVILIVLVKLLVPKLSGSKELELTYKSTGGFPYQWKYTIEDDSIVQFVGTKDITSEEDKKLDGGPVFTNYIFKGLKKGSTTISFKYVNINDGSIEKEEKVNVKVDKNKNISLVDIPN